MLGLEQCIRFNSKMSK